MFAASALATIVVGRLIAGFGVGFVSAIIILYMVRSVSRDFVSLVSADFLTLRPNPLFLFLSDTLRLFLHGAIHSLKSARRRSEAPSSPVTVSFS
jgi:hypothetical protein